MTKEKLIKQFKQTKNYLEESSHPLTTIREIYKLMEVFFEYMEGKDVMRCLQARSNQENMLSILQGDKEESGSKRTMGKKKTSSTSIQESASD